MVKNVFMHTTGSPTGGSPNPIAGAIQVQLKDNYRRFIGAVSTLSSPNGTPTTSTVANNINVITALGTATTAQWIAVGLPLGVTPAIGVAFIATSSALIGGSATTAIASAAGSSGDHIEVIGNPNLTVNPNPQNANGIGGYVYLNCYKGNLLTAPSDGTLITIWLDFDESSVLPGSGG